MAKRGGVTKRRRKANQSSTPATKEGNKKAFRGHLSHTSPLPNPAEIGLKITDFFPTAASEDVPDVASYEEVSNAKPQVLQKIFRKQKEKGTVDIKIEKDDEQQQTSQLQVETVETRSTTEPESKPKITKARRKLITSQSVNQENHKLTEYFTIRRSERKTKAVMLEEKLKNIEDAVLCGREEGLEVHYFPVKGRGVITTRAFHKSEFVVEYAGDLIDLAEARARELRYAADQNTGCYMYYFQYKNHSYCIDATAESNRLGRLVNHSRSGNLAPKVLEIKDRPHLVLVARRDIGPGEEVLYDYGDRSKDSLKHHPWLAY